jgi:hypothetical protein
MVATYYIPDYNFYDASRSTAVCHEDYYGTTAGDFHGSRPIGNVYYEDRVYAAVEFDNLVMWWEKRREELAMFKLNEQVLMLKEKTKMMAKGHINNSPVTFLKMPFSKSGFVGKTAKRNKGI